MSGLITLSKVCEEYANRFVVIFNGNKTQLPFFRVREFVSYKLNMFICGQVVNMCHSATHLSHFISSKDFKKHC